MTDQDCLKLGHDISSPAFLAFLNYLYSGEFISLDINRALEILSFLHYFSLTSDGLEKACMAVCIHYVDISSFHQVFDVVWRLREVPSCGLGDQFLWNIVQKLKMFCKEEMDSVLSQITDLDKACYMIKVLASRQQLGQILEEDSVQCRDRRACYILSDILSSSCGGEQFGTMQQVLKCLVLYAEQNGLVSEPDERADASAGIVVRTDELLRNIFDQEVIQLNASVVFPLITTHLTKLPFSF
jgi:hypothetical protein